MKLRKAHIKDVKPMQELIGRFAARGEMLPKSHEHVQREEPIEPIQPIEPTNQS